MFDRLMSIYRKEKFHPRVFSLFFNPFHFARKGLCKEIAAVADRVTGRTLDIGCGSKPYRDLFHSSHYIGLEIDSPDNKKKNEADYYYDGNAFPFESAEFDSVVTNQVFEHVFNPDRFLKEVNRVLKQSGILLITVPFMWDEHEQPFDYARYSSFGVKSLLENHGFRIIKQVKSLNDVRAIFQLGILYLYKKTATGNKYVDFLITPFYAAPFNIIGEILALATPRNNDLYLDNVILAEKINNA